MSINHAEAPITTALIIVALLYLAGIFFTKVQIPRLKGVYICDYQVGLLFENDRCKVLRPGKHPLIAGKDPVIIVDMRPYQFILEQQPFKDRLQIPSLISVGGELIVYEPELAVRKYKRVFDDSFVAVRENLREVASQFIADFGADGREDLVVQICLELNKKLHPSGMEIRNFVITELWSNVDPLSLSPTVAQ